MAVSFRQNHSSLDDETPQGIRDAGDSALHNSRMHHQDALNLERTHSVPRSLDDVVIPTDKPEIAVLIPPCHIACVVPPVMPNLSGPFRVIELSHE